MDGNIKKDLPLQISISIFLFFSLWWMYLQLYVPIQNIGYQFFGATYGMMALYGSLFTTVVAKKWGGLNSQMGKSIIFFALGLAAQEFGQLAYSFYTYYLHVEIPYPSIGDVGYFGSIPLYILGVFFLAKVAGVNIGLRTFVNKMQAIFLPIIMLILSYIFFLKDYSADWSKPLTIFLDFGYPFGQAIYISLATLTFLLSINILGGKMRGKILLILLALLIQYVADYMFLYQAHQGKIYAGSFNDYLYLLAYFIMTIGLLQLNNIHSDLSK